MANSVVEDYQFFQSLVVVGLVFVAFLTVKSLARSMAAFGENRLLDPRSRRSRRTGPAPSHQNEHDVLMAIGSGTFTGAELSQQIHISTNSVQTHVKHLLRKTGLNRRQDVMAVAYLLESNIF